METKDLRIGNLVYRITEDFDNLKIKKVIEWTDSIWGRISECLEYYEWFEPIPLTEEWLVKFGFHPNPKNTMPNIQMPYYVKKGVMLFYNESDKTNFLAGFGEMRSGKYYAVSFRWINHIHELQNLYFALTGEELKLSD